MNADTRSLSQTAEFMAPAWNAADDARVRGLEATVRRRDAVLAAVGYAASRFLGTADWDRDIREVLGKLGTAAEVHRVYLFEGYRDDRGRLRRKVRHSWMADSVAQRECDPAMMDVEIGAVGLGRWKLLEQGDDIHGTVASLPRGEQEFFIRLGVRSFAAVPVFAGGSWWGYLGLTDDVVEREWSRSVIEALRVAGATLGAAIYRNQAQEQLRQSEERYRRLTEAAFEGVIIHDEGVMLEANPAFGRIFGYEVEELVGRNLIDLIPTDESRALVREHMRTGSEATYEVIGMRKDGTQIITEICARQTSYRGRPARVATVHDVTEQRRSVAELERRETQLADAQAIAHLGSWDWDIASNSLTGSDEMYRIYGFELGQPLDTGSILSRIHPDDADLVRLAIDDAVMNGRGFALEHRVVRAPDDVRLLRSQGRVVTDASGATVKIIGAGQDITERREAEAVALRLREEQLARATAESAERRAATLAEASRLLGASFDYETTLSTLTRLAVPAMADYCTVDLVVRDGAIERVGVAHVDPQKEPLLREITRWLRTGRPIVGHLRRALDGQSTLSPVITDAALAAMSIDEEHGRIVRTIAPRSVISVPLLVSGTVVGVLALYMSESGRRYGADDLALAEELASRASLAVENARLFHEAQLATRERDQMLGVVAHDLRNPLGTILMASDLLEETLVPDSPAHRQVAMMKRAGERMKHLIQDLLDIKRIENGRLAVDPRPVSATALLTEAAEMLRSLAPAGSIDASLEADDDLPNVSADAHRVQQVLSNLIGNAIKFTPPGGRVTIRGSRQANEVRIAVSDTGAGIASEQLPHVFSQFWQGSRTDTRGIGLGLAIAKGIVDAHHGTIWVESTIGAGSTFFFTLPIQA